MLSTVHENLALHHSRCLDEIVEVSHYVLAVTKVKPSKILVCCLYMQVRNKQSMWENWQKFEKISISKWWWHFL